MPDRFTVHSSDWDGRRERHLVLAADGHDAKRAHREHFPDREIVAVVAGVGEHQPRLILLTSTQTQKES
jgi:hypothetical protein